MSDPSGREPEQRLPARRPPSEAAPAARFSAPESAHPSELSPERAAKIVRQSANARWVGFLVVCVVVAFMIGALVLTDLLEQLVALKSTTHGVVLHRHI